MNIDLNSHISLVSTDEIKKLCQQFFNHKKIPINHLNYIHKFNDGSVFYLCSNHAWIKHYISNQYMTKGAFETNSVLAKNRYVLWDSLDSNDVILKDSRELIHVEHGLTIIHQTKEGTGFFNVGNTDGDITHLNTYLNHLSALNEFVLYFYDNTKLLFQKAKQERLIIMPDQKHVHSLQDKLLHITQRERDCINWYLRGKNSGEIAIILGISRRTVETHIEHIKQKLNCTNLFQLGYSLAAMEFKEHGFIPEL